MSLVIDNDSHLSSCCHLSGWLSLGYGLNQFITSSIRIRIRLCSNTFQQRSNTSDTSSTLSYITFSDTDGKWSLDLAMTGVLATEDGVDQQSSNRIKAHAKDKDKGVSP